MIGKTIEDLAGCATDDLIGWVELKKGKNTRHAGALEGFAIAREEAGAMIMQARIKAGWIDEPALTPLVPVERGPVAEPQSRARARARARRAFPPRFPSPTTCSSTWPARI